MLLFDPKDIGKLLDDTIKPEDKAHLLTGLFVWVDTPQGFDFWYAECVRLKNGKNFSHEALMFLTVEYENANLVSDRIISRAIS